MKEKKNYAVTQVAKDNKTNGTISKYPGIMTDIDISPSDNNNKDHNIVISFSIAKDGKIRTGKKNFKNIFTSGRKDFQELIDNFMLLNEAEHGTKYIDFKPLTESFCIVTLRDGKEILKIDAADDYDGIDDEVYEFLESNVTPIDYEKLEVPDKVNYYRYIPLTSPTKEYLPGYEYHAYIKVFNIYEHGNGDCNVKISAYVFNGSNVRVIARFYNNIFTSGTFEFDEFCMNFGIDFSTEDVDLQSFVGVYCKVTLYENNKGNKYIDTIEPLNEIYQEYDEQYKLLIQEYRKNNAKAVR